jgi:glucan 1,3-beta-glucosidase
LPIPFWAIDTWDDEPFLAQPSWKYILRFLGWARKYGLRVAFDLHSVPGSQNGKFFSSYGGDLTKVLYFQHATIQGNQFPSWRNGIANAQRVLDYIRIFTEFISQPEHKNVVAVFGIMNKSAVGIVGKDQMSSLLVLSVTIVLVH